MLKRDLKTYYNSAFFRDDSKLIKEIHASITKPESEQTRTLGIENRTPQVSEPVTRPPTSTDLRSRRGNGFTMTTSVAPPRPAVPSTPARTQRPPSPSLTQAHPSRPPSPSTSQTQRPPVSNPLNSTSLMKTVLITDSILRHVQDLDTVNALGKGHELHLINKRDSTGLRDEKLREDLKRMKPDFIYTHLGINDVSQQFEVRHSLLNFHDFRIFISNELPQTRLFISLPLLTSDPAANEKIEELRDILTELVLKTNSRNPKPLKDTMMLFNRNSNFMPKGTQINEYFARDGVHLSDRGKQVILGNFRHHIHELTSLILNRPKTSRRAAEK